MRIDGVNTASVSLKSSTGSVSMRPVIAQGVRGEQGLPGNASAAWTASTAVTTGTVRQAPDGSWIKSTASRTTRATFDATEQGFWAATFATAGTLEATALTASYADIPRWQPNTTYAAGARALAPGGLAAVRKTAGTSGTTFDGSSWVIGLQSQSGEAVPTVKPSGDGRPGAWEMTHNDSVGYLFHLLCGASMDHSASALIGMGIDNDGIGLLISNKKLGRGITLINNATVTGSNAYGFQGTQSCTAAPLMRLEQQTSGAADVLQLLGFSGTSGNLLYVGDANGEAAKWAGDTGILRFQRDVQIKANPSDSAERFLEIATTPAAAANVTAKAYHGNSQTVYFGATGTNDIYAPRRILHGANTWAIETAANLTKTGKDPRPSDVSTWTRQIGVNNTGIGFFNATPVAKQSLTAAATDAATTQALANSLRTALINLGLAS